MGFCVDEWTTHLAVLARIRQGGLRLQIKMLLSLAVEHARQPMRRRCHRGLRIAAANLPGRADEASQLDGPLDRQDRLARR